MTNRTLIGLTVLLMRSNPAPLAAEIGVGREPPIKWIGDGIDRQAIRADLAKATQALRSFSLANHLEIGLRKLQIEHIEVFATKSAFDQRLKVVDKLPTTTTFPATYVAVVNGGVLYACSDQAAMASNPTLKTQADYVKLLTHEMAHALHIALVGGNEARMGPRWFYEGFAVVAAGQYADEQQISHGQYMETVSSHGKADYRLYGAAVRRLAESYPLAELVRRASQPGFSEWAAAAVSFL